ncbi:Hypothetical predicted protein [Marmota monax]|uniref:Ribosomal RNA-processing protein 7 homolog A n=1 Tax=Marmota monax TaxID=9995 RepID=A0A5E4BLF9_MARMO|nr:ribosomal RNA-processing protein 7 A [Marmota monax]VTJ70407.1 Hypothetical predicted protein [Marmota monax]
MVARRRKRAARDPEAGVPSPPGYYAIPIKFSAKQRASHYLYVREHRVREGTQSTWPQKRTLFVINVPPYCNEECLTRLLSPCGTVQSVELQEKPDLAESAKEPKSKFFHPMPIPGFQVAYVVFQKPSGVSAALTLRGPLLVSTESHPVKSGIHSQYHSTSFLGPGLVREAFWEQPLGATSHSQHPDGSARETQADRASWGASGDASLELQHQVDKEWISDYADSVTDPEALRVEVDTFMEAYDQKIAAEEEKAKEEEGVPDEEGWVKVTRRGRRPVLPRTEAASLRVLEKEKRKRARKELLNFYAWQHRETKMEHLAQLRKKFEEDKQRIELMRAQRKFRPY